MINIKFSIIMLVYNTKEEYLRYAISSVFNQVYQSYELIIIDDGSNKKTKDILKEFENRCIIKHQKNIGMSASRLEGLKLASGDYVIFVDSDDYIDPNTLSIYNEIINHYHVDIVMHDFVKFQNSIDNILKHNNFFREGIVDKSEVIKQLCMLHTNGTCGRAVKRKLFNGMSEYIDKTLVAVGEDVQQSTYVLLNAKSYYYTNKKIYYYRIVQEHREYNDYTRINDCNFLTPVYKMIFVDNSNYNKYLPIFKQNAINSVVFSSFRICVWSKNTKERNDLLNKVNELEITKIIKTIDTKCSIVSSILFFLLRNKLYLLFNILANIYNYFFKIQKI